MSLKNTEFEKSIISGEGNISVSSKLASELYSSNDGTKLSPSKFATQAREIAKQLKLGDNTPMVDKLASQAHLLDVLFTRTVQIAVNQDSTERMLALMDMALRVQNNARRTANTINELIHPKIANNYIRTDTANVATNQQINYSEKYSDNELNSGDLYEVDGGITPSTGRKNKAMEAMVKVDRAKN